LLSLAQDEEAIRCDTAESQFLALQFLPWSRIGASSFDFAAQTRQTCGYPLIEYRVEYFFEAV
jgi:hypothetical protein